jgi:tRNA threonylcarbamoyladenosine dehydratase
MPTASFFDYASAYSRNIGWVTLDEQEKLRHARVAIAGLGGVGGAYAMTLARLGIGQFNLADFDSFEVHNINRQAGAFVSSFGQPKIDVIERLVQDINPEARVRLFPNGVSVENIDEFLNEVDVYVDGLDFFALPIRRLVFTRCRERGIPAITVAPLGMGAAFLYFPPHGMTFEEYFRFEGHDLAEQYARFIAGLSPSMMNLGYLVVPEAVNFKEKRGPSTIMACDLCAGIMGSAVLKVILGRGGLKAVPWGVHFDAYHQKMKSTWRPFGNANPIQWLLLKFIRPKFRGG